MKPMRKDEFIKFVDGNPGEAWTAAPEVANHLDMHIPPAEQVLGWLRLEDHIDRDPKVYGVIVVLTERFFLRVSASVNEARNAAQVDVESVPLGRLRSVKTRTGAPGAGVVVLDFAGTVLQGGRGDIDGDQILIRVDKGWPSPAVKEFMDALASIRK